MHQTQSSRYLTGFSYEKSAGRRYRQCFILDKSCRKMYTIFSAVQRKQRKSDVMTCFGHFARSAIYYRGGYPLTTGKHRAVRTHQHLQDTADSERFEMDHGNLVPRILYIVLRPPCMCILDELGVVYLVENQRKYQIYL
jgi:hypothetical protein